MRVLLDTDALLAMYVERDALHEKAVPMTRRLVAEKAELFVSNLVLQETVTVLSYRHNQETAVRFLTDFERSGFLKIFIDENLADLAWQLFKRQTQKGMSFVDCSNVVTYKEMKFEAIFSFDKFYSRNETPRPERPRVSRQGKDILRASTILGLKGRGFLDASDKIKTIPL